MYNIKSRIFDYLLSWLCHNFVSSKSGFFTQCLCVNHQASAVPSSASPQTCFWSYSQTQLIITWPFVTRLWALTLHKTVYRAWIFEKNHYPYPHISFYLSPSISKIVFYWCFLPFLTCDKLTSEAVHTNARCIQVAWFSTFYHLLNFFNTVIK